MLMSDLSPTFYGHNVMFDVEIVSQATGQKLLKAASIFVPPTGEPRFELRDKVV